jgi:hypothetical protein
MHGEDAPSGDTSLTFTASLTGITGRLAPRRTIVAAKRQTGEVRCGEDGA